MYQSTLFEEFTEVPIPLKIGDPSRFIDSVFSEMKADNPNYELFRQVVNGGYAREDILRNYRPLGLTTTLENDRGLPDMAAKRKLNMGQFFTPLKVVEALTEVTALDHGTGLKILDNSCGIGSMFRYVYDKNDIYGVELDPLAYAMAQELWPEAHIINDSLLNQYQMEGVVHASLINPPFSLHLEKKNIRLDNCGWGKLGPRSSIESHIAALEIALIKSSIVVGAIVPTSFFSNEKTYSFEKWVTEKSTMEKILRIDLPKNTFEEYGTRWECSIIVYISKRRAWGDPLPEFKQYSPKNYEELQESVILWKNTPEYHKLKERVTDYSQRSLPPCYPGDKLIDFAFEPVEGAYENNADEIKGPSLPIEFQNKIKVCINPNGSGIRLKPSDLLTGLMLQRCINNGGVLYGEHNLQNISTWKWDLKLSSILTGTPATNPEEYYDQLRDLGITVEIDPQVQPWLAAKKAAYERNITPFENTKYNEETGEWDTHFENEGLRSKYAQLYEEREKRLEALGVNWLWDYQKDDVIRMSLKKSTLYAAGMGLGKTRVIIALGLLYGCSRNLIIVEPKLVNEFLREFKKLGINDVQTINSVNDVYIDDENGIRKTTLKKFNIISYRKLWAPLDKGTNKTFAKILKKLCNFVALDEAHKIKGKDTKQGKAARAVCQKAKHVLLCTGTPIANYPRNIYPLLVAGWGDGTELNPYGYVNPLRGWNNITPGTRAFSEAFVSIEWVTEQFAQTLDTGRKAREIPVIKDINSWNEMIAPVMIRRRKTEPDVRKYMPDLKPVFHEHEIMPNTDHILFYREWLTRFADWFKKQLELRKINPSHNISTAIILAHLTKLDLASTIPQSTKMINLDMPSWGGGLTPKQEKTIELTLDAVHNGNKVIVYSGRPEFQEHMQRELKKHNIVGYTFTGKNTPGKRNVILDDFRNNPDVHVLLATTSCGDTGLNIPEASVVIFADVNWTPSKTQQAYSRILRPDQENEPHIHMIRNRGMIDEYMIQLCNLKKEGINQAIDGHNAEEFDPDSWMSYRDFSYKMLTELGLL